MKFMMKRDSDLNVIMFECDADDAVLKAKSICREDIFSTNQITDFRVIHNALNFNLNEHGEFRLVARVNEKDYSFIILPNPNDLLEELNINFENKLITTNDALAKISAIVDYSDIWGDIIVDINESDDNLPDTTLLIDVYNRISAQHFKEFQEANKKRNMV